MKGFVSPILYCSFLHIATLIPGSYYNRLYAQRLPFHNFNIQDGLIQAHVRRLAPKLAYSFEVIAPFQKTNWFLCGILGCCLLSGILIQYIISERNLRQIRQVDKRYAEEQSRSRILAAKDFQEEISDKLTSINMLTRQLKSKIIITPDNTSIINQIEQQTTGLYNSTSELLWLLDPANENLYHVLHHIRDLANDLLKDAPRAFTLTGDENKWPQYYLPSDRGRDLILIFKEAIDNAARYADAKNISLSVKWKTKGILQMILRDDGIGFDLQTVKKGHGIKVMRMRADRIKGKLYLDSRKNKGTIINLTFKIPQNKNRSITI